MYRLSGDPEALSQATRSGSRGGGTKPATRDTASYTSPPDQPGRFTLGDATIKALLFSDVVDSTALVARLGDERAAKVWADHDARARTLLAVHRGREIDRTDGFFLLFDAAADAARYAKAYHQAIGQFPAMMLAWLFGFEMTGELA